MSIKVKIISLLAVLVIFISFLVAGVYASASTNLQATGSLVYDIPDATNDFGYLTFEYVSETDKTLSITGFSEGIPTTVEIPPRVKYGESDIVCEIVSIGASAFENCTSITKVQLPTTLTEIGNSAFNGCTGLVNITINDSTPPTLGTTAIPDSSTIYVPAGSEGTYASSWGLDASRFSSITA